MAVDLEAIRRKVAELNGQRRNSSVQLWKPEPGKHLIRGLPWKSTPDGVPFKELQFYYLGDNPRFLAPSQFGKPDPVRDLIRKLYSSNSPDDRQIAKKLHPKMMAYLPIYDRNHEEKGIQVWSFNKFIYQRLMSFFLNETIGDFLDPLEGFDLEVEIKPSGKKFNGREVMDTVVDVARRPSKLYSDAEKAKKLLDSVPEIGDMYPQKTTEEVEKLLNAWLSGDQTADTTTDGSGRGEQPLDELEKLAKEVKAEVKAETRKQEAAVPPAAASEKPRRVARKADLDDEPTVPAKHQTLDEAFADLKDDEE
jgi:hypothetical protein